MKIKVSDYIVEFFIEKNITDIFGYPGGMVTYLLDSLYKYKDKISTHVNYHEQAASFCACGYAQVKNIPGVSYSTSGPGATNLLTGIANAYFDSIPTIFLTGQVNTYESKGDLKIRQKGFQEANIIEMAKPITKYVKYIENASDIVYELEKAYEISMSGRKGPVLLDIPMNVFRAEIDKDIVRRYKKEEKQLTKEQNIDLILKELLKAERPIIIAGAGIRANGLKNRFGKIVNKLGIPFVTSMIAIDLQNVNPSYYFGFIGVYGNRCANFLIEKSDLILTFGTRLDSRQTGNNKELFAPNARIIRIDIDENELENKIHEDEIQIVADIKDVVEKISTDDRFILKNKFKKWFEHCKVLKEKIAKKDYEIGNKIVEKISEIVEENTVITADVGQNQVWVAQSFKVKNRQKVLFSGGHGAMGYSLPAAIGAYYGEKLPCICFCGDGGLQMNIQELAFIASKKIPVKIIVLNNKSLGMIRHFQEMYFDSRYAQTTENTGYFAPNFCKIANAYGIESIKIQDIDDELQKIKDYITNESPVLIEINMESPTYVYPKLAVNNPLYNQEPKLDGKLIKELLDNSML